MPASDRQLSARDVILEIVHNMREGVEHLLYSSVAPAVYYVFLHPDDFERLSPLTPRLVAEARRALDDELRAMNAADRFTPGPVRRWLGRPPAVERPQDDWVIRLEPDPDGELAPGHIAITSELTLPPRQQFDGTETRRVTTVKRGESTETNRQTVSAPPEASRSIHATISYTDHDGAHTYEVEKDRIVVGRGGVGYWVDVKVNAPADVSREHLRIRRDPGTGRFYLKDLSSFGTSVDGVQVPRSIELAEGEKRDLEIEVPLPDRARIELAGMIVLEFATRPARS
jgi:hypothetical protein